MPMAKMSYGAKWNPNNNTTVLATLNTMHPQERILLGIVQKPSRRMTLFAELKADPQNKTDMLAGYRINFQEAMMSGSLTSNFKAVASYKKMVNEMMQVTFTGVQDFKN
jgi:hypothetical protein